MKTLCIVVHFLLLNWLICAPPSKKWLIGEKMSDVFSKMSIVFSSMSVIFSSMSVVFSKTNGIARNISLHQCACTVLQTTSMLENVNITTLYSSRARARIVQEFYAFYFHICHTQPKILKMSVLPCDRLHFNKTRTVTPSFFSVWQQCDSNCTLLSPLSAHVY